jgi:hypothetical protein
MGTVTDKREAKRRYKQSQPVMGVYKVENLAEGRIFLGSSMNVHGTLNSCRFQLDQGIHMNRDLQRDYTRLGGEKFAFAIVDSLEPKEDAPHDYAQDLAVLEEMWKERLQPYGDRGYNRKKELRA